MNAPDAAALVRGIHLALALLAAGFLLAGCWRLLAAKDAQATEAAKRDLLASFAGLLFVALSWKAAEAHLVGRIFTELF